MGESGGARLSLQRRVGKSYAIAAAGRCLSGGDEADAGVDERRCQNLYRGGANRLSALEAIDRHHTYPGSLCKVGHSPI